MIPGVKVVRRGTRAYIPKKKLQDIVERGVRPLVEKEYSFHIEKNDVQSVGGFQVGLRELTIELHLSLAKYALNFLQSENDSGKLVFLLEDQMVKGQVKVHVDKQLDLLVTQTELINKDYIIDFALLITKLIVEVDLKATKDGVPQIGLKLSLENLDLANNLKFDVENKDILTSLIDLLKGVWLPIVEGVLMESLLPKANEEITKTINDTLIKEFKREIPIEGPLCIQIDLTIHEILIGENFIILTIDGHFNNFKNPRDMDQVAHPTFDMPKIIDELRDDEIAVQISYDNVYTLIYAILQNRVDIQIDVDKSICNSVTVYREPNYSAVIALLPQKEDNTKGEKTTTVGIKVDAEIFSKITVDLKPLPDFSVKVKARTEVCDVKILDGKRTADEFFMTISIANTEVLGLYGEDMNPSVDLKKNNVVYNKLRDKMSKDKITQEIKVKAVKLGERGKFMATRLVVEENYIVLVGMLTI